MKKASLRPKWLSILALLLFLLLATSQRSHAQSKTFYWERFDVDINLLEDGAMRIVETQTLAFSGDTFSFGFRGIPVGNNGNNDGIVDISVNEGGIAYSLSGSNRPETFDVKREAGEEVITWYFEPTIGRHTYTISYTVLGGVRLGTMDEGSGDQVFWKPTPTDLPARIDTGTITLHMPEGVRPQQFTGTTDYLVAAYINGDEDSGVDIRVSEDGRTISYVLTQGIIPGEVLEIRAQFPHGLLSIPLPAWQDREQSGDRIGLAVLVIALLITVGGPLLVLLLWYTAGRDPEAGIVVPEYLSEPPSDLPPGIVGTLVDEKADMRDIISTLIDLARRGYLTIEEEKNNHTFHRVYTDSAGLRPYERKFLEFVFRGKEKRSLNSLRYKFAEKLPELRNMLYDELKNEELVPRSPQSVRNSYGCLSWVILIAAVGSFFALPATLGETVSTAICPALALGLTGVVMLITSRFMPVKSRKGVEAAAKWEAFKAYLQNAERYAKLEEATDIFEKYLAYATAFGLERTWIRKFAAIPATPVPTWYGPYYVPHRGSRGGRELRRSGGPESSGGGPSLEGMSGSLTGGLQSMSDGFTRMLNSTATIFKSTPPSSSGGSSGGFSGGFSGGSSGGGGSAGFG